MPQQDMFLDELQGRKGGEADFEEPETLTDTDDTVSDTSSETTSEDDVSLTDAGDTGDGGAGTSDDTPGPVPYDRFREVNERAKRADALQAEVAAFQQLAQTDPVVAQAVRDAQLRAQGIMPQPQQEAASEPEDEFVLPEGWEPASEGERFLADMVLTQAQKIKALSGEVGGVKRFTENTTAEQIRATCDQAVNAIASEAGIELSDEDKMAVIQHAAYVQEGARVSGKAMSIPEAIRAGYAIVASTGLKGKADTARAERDAATARAKAAAAAGRPGNVRGPVTSAAPTKMSRQEAADRAWAETEHLFTS